MEDSAKDNKVLSGTEPVKTAEVVKIANKVYVTGDGKYPIDHPKVKIHPQWGNRSKDAGSYLELCRSQYRCPSYSRREGVNIGRRYTSCKECLPLCSPLAALYAI